MIKGVGEKSNAMRQSTYSSVQSFVCTAQSSTGLFARRQIGHLTNDYAHLMLKPKLILDFILKVCRVFCHTVAQSNVKVTPSSLYNK